MIERTESFPVSREEMWKLLTDPSYLTQWFGMDCVELELKRGGRVVFKRTDGLTRPALVEEVDSPTRLVFRWLPFEVGPEGATHSLPGSTVELTLLERNDGTELVVREIPVPGTRSAIVEPLVIDTFPHPRFQKLVFKV